eukprot:4719589-Pleurochrysis_carterae.AAC.4
MKHLLSVNVQKECVFTSVRVFVQACACRHACVPARARSRALKSKGALVQGRQRRHNAHRARHLRSPMTLA